MSDKAFAPPITLESLIHRFGGEARGQVQRVIDGVAPLDRAGPNELAFLSNPRYRSALASSRAACVLVKASEVDGLSVPPGTTLWLHDNPYAQFARVAQTLVPKAPRVSAGVHASAVVVPGALVADSASIGPYCVIEAGAVIGARVQVDAGSYVGAQARIGEDTHLYPRVTVYHGCEIGQRCIFHSGVVLGADGFGFAADGDAWIKIPQSGRVLVGNDVEIGANTTIDRGTMGDTVIGDGVKMDNQIQIGHNCEIGEATVMAGCSAVAGSTKIGRRCLIGGAAMIIGHLSITDGVTISVGTVVSHSIHRPGFYTGFYPMAENSAWEKSAVLVRQLDRMRARLLALEKQIKNQQGRS